MKGIIDVLTSKWYLDCLTYNIPVSPSDVRDIVEELVEMVPINEEATEMKKYTIRNCEEFCKNALGYPPFEEFENGSIDEKEWYDAHQIHITVGNHDMELEYNADNATEIEGAIKEMYESKKCIKKF